GTAEDQTLDEIFGNGAGSRGAIFGTAADRQQLFRKGQRLNAAASAGRRYHAPHAMPPAARVGRPRTTAPTAGSTVARGDRNCVDRASVGERVPPGSATCYPQGRAR